MQIHFPDSWDVIELPMAGHGRPPLSDDEMRAAVQNPIESPRLSELSKGAKNICILFDDITKATPAGRIAQFVLEELYVGGITDDQIRFLCAPGAHRPSTNAEFVSKLGAEIVERFPVYNHNPWAHLEYIGMTRQGTPVHINKEFLYCDLRIGIGGIFPHLCAGYGGGGKIVLPGVCGMESISHHHLKVRQGWAVGNVESDFRHGTEEAARMAGLCFKVDAVFNERCEVTGLFAGDVVAEHRAGSKLADEIYPTTKKVVDADIVIANAYPDEHQIMRTQWAFQESLREGGDAVIVCYIPNGQVLHQYSMRFGTEYGGPGWRLGLRQSKLSKARHLFFLAPSLSGYDRQELAIRGKFTWAKEWSEILSSLEDHHGSGTQVAVYPYASMQTRAFA
jgi:nickel-dependent lactate racemase